ncbi:MAG: hypothetical protein ACAH59_01030 [Pseudobdellovibrionaceae bacterium]
MKEMLEFLKDCVSYPSGDNAQPFRFRAVSDRVVEVFHDSQTASHRLNFKNVSSLLTLGTLIETLSLRAQKEKKIIRVKYHLDQYADMDLQKWATVELLDATGEPDPSEVLLSESLQIRHVDRRLYKTEPLAEADIQWLTKEASKNSNLSFSLNEKFSSQLEKLFLKHEEEIWKDSLVAQDVLSWIRFNSKQALATRDGMTWASLNVPAFQKPLVKLFVKFPRIYQLIARLGGTKNNRQMLIQHLAKSGGFGWLAVRRTDPQSLVDAGRTFFRMWLYLNHRGYSFQPLTMLSLLPFQSQLNLLPEDWSPQLMALYPKILEQIQKEAMIEPQFLPLWGFRAGRVEKPLTSEKRTFRKNIEELIIQSGGSKGGVEK